MVHQTPFQVSSGISCFCLARISWSTFSRTVQTTTPSLMSSESHPTSHLIINSFKIRQLNYSQLKHRIEAWLIIKVTVRVTEHTHLLCDNFLAWRCLLIACHNLISNMWRMISLQTTSTTHRLDPTVIGGESKIHQATCTVVFIGIFKVLDSCLWSHKLKNLIVSKFSC